MEEHIMVRHVIVWTLKDESSGDAMLDSLFESEEALKGYSSNPLHVEVANTKVRPFVKVRSSFDYLV